MKEVFPLPTLSEMGAMDVRSMQELVRQKDEAVAMQLLISFLTGKGFSRARWVIRHKAANRKQRRHAAKILRKKR